VVAAAVQDQDLVAPVVDFSIPVASAHLWFGELCPAEIWANYSDGKPVSCPLGKYVPVAASSLELKKLIEAGTFTLTEPIASIPMERLFCPKTDGEAGGS